MARKGTVFAVLLVLAAALGASAQRGMRMPQLQGVWNPVVGSGANYQYEGKDGHKGNMEVAIVGTESVDGKPGYWLEMSFDMPGGGGTSYNKMLFALDGKQIIAKKMVMQAPGQPPLEMPLDMMNRMGGETQQAADLRDKAERVGTETITTPAGTFSCEHWRAKDGSNDVWYTEKVAPWGLVKSTGRDSNLLLTKVITGAKTHIIGTPQKFDPSEMMRQRMPH